MTRFEINKFMAHVDGDPEPLHAFSEDPSGFVEAWCARATDAAPGPTAGHLDDAEKQAIVGLDYGEMYRMGAHPYLLLHFARAIECDARGADFLVWKEEYRAQVAPHGYPGFGT